MAAENIGGEFAGRRVVDQFKVELVFTDCNERAPMRRAVHRAMGVTGVVVAGTLLLAAGGRTGEADGEQKQGEAGRFSGRGRVAPRGA